jgi:hypothetical protein
MWSWIASVVLSLAMAIVLMRAHARNSNPERREGRWVLIAAAFAVLYALLGLGQLVAGKSMVARVIGWALVALAVFIGVGTWSVRKKHDRLAQRLLALAGFFALPTGLILVLVSREIAALTLRNPLGASGTREGRPDSWPPP